EAGAARHRDARDPDDLPRTVREGERAEREREDEGDDHDGRRDRSRAVAARVGAREVPEDDRADVEEERRQPEVVADVGLEDAVLVDEELAAPEEHEREERRASGDEDRGAEHARVPADLEEARALSLLDRRIE